MATLFISDLHLNAQQPKTVCIFLNFLQKYAADAEALYILGDFFEAWLGDDDRDPFNQTLIHALHDLTQNGVPVYFMHGNRDFLAGSAFMRESGCQALTDPTLIDLYGTPVLLMHGDLLCTNDKRYLRFRKWVRRPWVQKLFLKLPLKLRKSAAAWMRNQSKQSVEVCDAHENLHDNRPKTLSKDEVYRFDVSFDEIVRMMARCEATVLIHGHVHKPSIHLFQLNQRWFKRIVLSDWHDEGNVLICEPDGKSRLIYFDEKSSF